MSSRKTLVKKSLNTVTGVLNDVSKSALQSFSALADPMLLIGIVMVVIAMLFGTKKYIETNEDMVKAINDHIHGGNILNNTIYELFNGFIAYFIYAGAAVVSPKTSSSVGSAEMISLILLILHTLFAYIAFVPDATSPPTVPSAFGSLNVSGLHVILAFVLMLLSFSWAAMVHCSVKPLVVILFIWYTYQLHNVARAYFQF